MPTARPAKADEVHPDVMASVDTGDASADAPDVQPALAKPPSLFRYLSDSISKSVNRPAHLKAKLRENLEHSTMFRKCSSEQLDRLAEKFEPLEFQRGDVLQLQGALQERALIVVEGSVVRQRVVDDQLKVVGSLGAQDSSASVGMLHLLRKERSFATLKAHSAGAAFQIRSEVLAQAVRDDPELALAIIASLTHEVRMQSARNAVHTPLFMQKGKQLAAEPLPWFAVTCAAAVESFYRSAMNALINSALTGKPRAALFPNMHIQVPTRIVYINGFKSLRSVLDAKVDLETYEFPQLAGLGVAVLPGLIMTPVSSLLEASNAGHTNPEPMATRWMRGLLPRAVREVVFGIGINQLSDYMEERLPVFQDNQTMRNFAGSFCAGLVAGYLSHVPHSMSALKLLNPQKSYGQLFAQYSEAWDRRVPQNVRWRRPLVGTLACIFPKGCLVRSAQISGSFIIINSTINALKHLRVKLERADSSS